MKHAFHGRHWALSVNVERGPHRGRRGGGRIRLISRGELRLLILKLLEEGPRHGYELIKAFEEMTSGAYAPSPGMIYPGLALLEDVGEIAGSDEDSRKQYSLTDKGRAELVAKADEVGGLLKRLTEYGQSRASEESGPIRRALDNLRAVLAERSSGGELDRDAQLAIADLIDDAARKIERL